jgi:hypothetical protein
MEWRSEQRVGERGESKRTGTSNDASHIALSSTSSPHLVASAERSSNQAQAQGPTTRRRRATPTSLAADDNRRARSPPRAIISSDSGSRESTNRRQAPDRVRHGPPKVRLECDPRALCAVRSSAVNSMTGGRTLARRRQPSVRIAPAYGLAADLRQTAVHWHAQASPRGAR